MRIQNVRFIIAAITTFSAYAVYVSRVNLSIAIIAMVEEPEHLAKPAVSAKANASLPLASPPAIHDLDQLAASSAHGGGGGGTTSVPSAGGNSTADGNSNSTNHHEPLASIRGTVTSVTTLKMPLISQEKFHWDQTEQGHILGAFFYGYILFQIPGARMAESVGAKWIIMAASAGSALISLAFPLSTQLNSIQLLMVLRFVMGLCQSAFFPAAYVLFCRWLPECERSVLLPIMFIGSNMGSISTYIMSSYLVTSAYGWPSVFYLSGLVCSLCSLLWWLCGSDGPHDNWLITDQERRFIELNVDNQSSESNSIADDGCLDSSTKKTHPPARIAPEPSWPKLLGSVPVWVLILSMYGNEWSNVVICYELPTYLNTALKYPIEQNGVWNSFFQLSYAVASPIMSSLGAYLLERHFLGMRKIHVRKLFQSLATFGQLACFISVPICGDNRPIIIMFMFLAIVFKACANAGDIMVPGDLSPEYAGTIFAFANSIGNTAGFIVPLLAGFFVKNPRERAEWAYFWFTTATIMGFSGLVFLLLGETRRQDFGLDEPSLDCERATTKTAQRSELGEKMDGSGAFMKKKVVANATCQPPMKRRH